MTRQPFVSQNKVSVLVRLQITRNFFFVQRISISLIMIKANIFYLFVAFVATSKIPQRFIPLTVPQSALAAQLKPVSKASPSTLPLFRSQTSQVSARPQTITGSVTNPFRFRLGGYKPLINYLNNSDWQRADNLARSQYRKIANATVKSVEYQPGSVWLFKTIYDNGINSFEVIASVQLKTNTMVVSSIKQILPVAGNRMTYSSTTSTPKTRTNFEPSSFTLGGFRRLVNYENNKQWQKADQFTRSQYPRLSNATVKRVDYLIVSGWNYKTIYQIGLSSFQVIVYIYPQGNSLKVSSFIETKSSSVPSSQVIVPTKNLNGNYMPISNYQNNVNWQRADQLARSTYSAQLANAIVVEVISVSKDYKTTYKNGDNIYQVVVYFQPLTNTFKISSFKQIEDTPAAVVNTAQCDSPSQNTFALGGYSSFPQYQSDSDWQRTDQLARSTYPVQLANAAVVCVRIQFVSGINYKTIYQNGNNTYQAIVYDRPASNTLMITSFKKI